jgi:hypothetical protein
MRQVLTRNVGLSFSVVALARTTGRDLGPSMLHCHTRGLQAARGASHRIAAAPSPSCLFDPLRDLLSLWKPFPFSCPYLTGRCVVTDAILTRNAQSKAQFHEPQDSAFSKSSRYLD